MMVGGCLVLVPTVNISLNSCQQALRGNPAGVAFSIFIFSGKGLLHYFSHDKGQSLIHHMAKTPLFG